MNKILDAEKREELHFKSLLEVSTLVRNRCISSVELTESLLRRIESLDGRQKSYATVMADHALAAAERADKELTNQKYRGPLHGIPIVESLEPGCVVRGFFQWIRGRYCGRIGLWNFRQRHWRIHPLSGGLLWGRRFETDLG